MNRNIFIHTIVLFTLVLCSFILSKPVLAADPTQMQYYIDKYGFANSTTASTMSDAKKKQLEVLAPYFGKGVAAFNKHFNQDMDPQLVMWWTASEGTQEQTHSNCANVDMILHNCTADPTFWQLGPAGIQFKFLGYYFGTQADTKTPLLKAAFADLKGDPNDAGLVQKVGQAVLDYDKAHKNANDPDCGSMPCTFPSQTIDQIYKDMHCGAAPCSGGTPTDSNWWGSVLTRDPEIGGYIQARGLDQIKGSHCAGIGDPRYCSGGTYIPRLNNWMYTVLNMKLNYNGPTTGTSGSTVAGQDDINVIPNFKNKFNDYYTWAKDNLFDGLEFFKGDEGSSDTSGGVSASCNQPAATSIGDAQSRAKSLWGYSIIDGGGLDLNRAKQIFNTLCLLNSSSKWASLTGAKTTEIRLHINGGGCLSSASGTGDIQLNGYCGAIWTDRFILTHEIGHIVQFRNPAVESKFRDQVYNSSKSRHGFPQLPTWDCQFDYGVGPFEQECWADMIATYVTYKDMRQAFGQGPFGSGLSTTQPGEFNIFPTEYSDYYNFAKNEVFGGTDFYSTSSTGGSTSTSATPNTNTCNNVYNLAKTGNGKNYGDPNCDFKKEDLSTYLVDLDKKNNTKDAANWYGVIAICESSYNPNAYLAASTSGFGAYGLFQMNPTGKGNGQFDAGDVYWKTQADNATTYKNTVIKGNWTYWGSRNGCQANGNQGVK